MSKSIYVSSEHAIGPLLGMAHRMLSNSINRAFQENGYDLTLEQWIILRRLHEADGMMQQHFADIFCKNKASITSLLDNLEKRNMVVRIPDRLDKRNKLIYLTPLGKKLQEELLLLASEKVFLALEDISAEDLSVCYKVLGRVIENMSEQKVQLV
jgi:DNA-binding MarR family transcriptional regulator